MTTGYAYALGIAYLLTPGADWVSDTIKCSLHTSSYAPDQDTHDFFSDLTNEVVGTGYVAGGTTLASKTVTYDSAVQHVKANAANATWPTSTITARFAVVYLDTGSAATSPLLAYFDFETNVISTGSTFTVAWNGGRVLIGKLVN